MTADVTPLIIEARVNEYTSRRAGNPNVPYSPEEIVNDAVAVWEAGASIVHWHARDPETGAPSHDPGLFRDVIAGLRDRTDLLIYPTLGANTAPAVSDRVSHILAVQDDPILRVDIVPVDFGPSNLDAWDPARTQFRTYDRVYNNTRGSLKEVLEVFREHDIFVASVCWDAGQIRTALRFREMGLLGPRTLWEIVFGSDRLPVGFGISVLGLQALVAEIPPGEPWLVECVLGDVFPLAALAIVLGGHVAIGLGDFSYTRLGAPTNADLVRRLAALSETLGRPVATPAQTRDLLGLPARSRMAARPARPSTDS
ncbi:MAG TPA: 3-keto-5-aminohexanoate cleavage protein [Dehalococcoidia bacterium]|nr:3-keto-5-aminohexanoate cleavage protein [Dehalococcoidia bacterium]